MAEITSLHTANHPNVVRLLGSVFSEYHRAIVYELAANRSLDKHLYAQANLGPFQPPGATTVHRAIPTLDWATRMRIALGVADALIYLHTTLKVIHRDVKVSNVLLDDNFVPKLTDFGLATKVIDDYNGVEVPHIVDPIKGTPGCAAPETETLGTCSTRSDVYSYGVFLLTLFTGRLAYDPARSLTTRRISEWVMHLWSKGEMMTLVLDYSLGQMYSVEGFERLFLAIRMCIESNYIARPNMISVKAILVQAAEYPTVHCPSVSSRLD